MRKLMAPFLLAVAGLCMSCHTHDPAPVTHIDSLQAAKDFREILCGAKYGWHMRYFPQVDPYLNSNITENIKTNYNSLYPEILSRRLGTGGYNLFLKFSPDGTLKILTDIPYLPEKSDKTPEERQTYYYPSFNLETSEAEYDIKVAEGLNLILATPTMLDQLKPFNANTENRFSPVKADTGNIVLRTANYLDGKKELIELTPLRFPLEEWKEHMKTLIARKEAFRKRSFASGGQKSPKPCSLQVILTETGEVVYQSSMDFGYVLMNDRINYRYNHSRQNGERVARYDRSQYELFYKNEQPEKTLDTYDGSTYYTALGSGYIATEEGVFFWPGFKFNDEVVFRTFKEVGSKEWACTYGPYTAKIK